MADIFAAGAPALLGGCDFVEEMAAVLARWPANCDAAAFLAEWLTIEVDRSVLALVVELRRAGVRCAIASNQEAYRARHMSEALAYRELFDAEFYSHQLGFKKPSPAYFTALIGQGGFDPAKTLFVDDREDNVQAARASGLLAEQFALDEIGQGGVALRALLRRLGLVWPAA